MPAAAQVFEGRIWVAFQASFWSNPPNLAMTRSGELLLPFYRLEKTWDSARWPARYYWWDATRHTWGWNTLLFRVSEQGGRTVIIPLCDQHQRLTWQPCVVSGPGWAFKGTLSQTGVTGQQASLRQNGLAHSSGPCPRKGSSLGSPGNSWYFFLFNFLNRFIGFLSFF